MYGTHPVVGLFHHVVGAQVSGIDIEVEVALGVLAGLIAGCILSRVFGRSRSVNGSGEIRLMEKRY